MLNQRRQKAFLGGKKPFGRLWEVVEELKQKKKAEAEAAGQEVAPEEDLVGATTTAEEAAEVYIRHVARVPTPAVRGRACASAERVTEAVLQDVDVATQLPNCLLGLAGGFRLAQLGSKDGAAALKKYGSEGRIGPAAGSPECQTLLSERLETSFKPCLYWLSSGTARVQGRCRSTKTPWPRPGGQSAKRCFLNA